MSNRRVSELISLIWSEVAPNDLFLITDVSQYFSKKITAGNLKTFVLDGASVLSASYATTASYVDLTAYDFPLVDSASYALTSSYAITASYADLALSCSYMSGAYISGPVPSSSYSDTASYLLYRGYDNGTAFYAISASFVINAASSSFLNYYGDPTGMLGGRIYNNGTASRAITASYSLDGVSSLQGTNNYFPFWNSNVLNTASILQLTRSSVVGDYLKVGPSNIYGGFLLLGGSSAFPIPVSSSRISTVVNNLFLDSSGSDGKVYLNFYGKGDVITNVNGGKMGVNTSTPTNQLTVNGNVLADSYTGSLKGSSSYALSSSYSQKAKNADYSTLAGTANYALYADVANSAYYATSSYTSQFAGSSSYAISSSYAVTASYVATASYLGESVYNIFGPFTASYLTATESWPYQYLEIGRGDNSAQPTIIYAYGDAKIPLENGDNGGYVKLQVEDLTPSGTWSADLDNSSMVNYMNFTSGAFSGYMKTGYSLNGKINLSGSLLRMKVMAGNGTLLDTTRDIKFYVYTKAKSARII
jgi:hypothetical protein